MSIVKNRTELFTLIAFIVWCIVWGTTYLVIRISVQVFPFKKVGAHFHNSGIEIYHIVSGNGKMHTGFINNGMVDWAEAVEIKSRDCFTISEKEVHQLENTGAERLVALFICRTSHLGDDRIIV